MIFRFTLLILLELYRINLADLGFVGDFRLQAGLASL